MKIFKVANNVDAEIDQLVSRYPSTPDLSQSREQLSKQDYKFRAIIGDINYLTTDLKSFEKDQSQIRRRYPSHWTFREFDEFLYALQGRYKSWRDQNVDRELYMFENGYKER